MTDSPRLEIRLLGRFAALRDGVEIPTADYGGRKVRTLIRILAARRGHFVSNDVLTEMLWPDRAPADPAANLQVLVNRARRALGDASWLLTGPSGYSLTGSSDVVVDAEALVGVVTRARTLPDEAALDELTRMLREGAGEPLAEDAYSDWASEYRQRLTRARQEALELAAQCALHLGAAATAVGFAAEAVQLDPLREVAALTLVRAHVAAGDPAEALTSFDQYRRVLADELGLDPSDEAVALQHQLLAGTARPALPLEPTLRRPTTIGELPFVGREQEVEAVLASLHGAGADRSVTVLIAASSGGGKSRLVQTVATRTPTVVVRAVLPERAEPWSLTRALLRELLAADVAMRDALPPRLEAALASLLPELESESLPAGDPESRHALIHEAALRLLAAADRVVAVDDLQWADPTSLTLLETAASRVPGLRMVLAFRPDEVSDNPAAAALIVGVHATLRLDLGGLTRAGIDALVADEGLAVTLAAHTDRTPLAITEALRAAAAQGAIERSVDGRWVAVDADTTRLVREVGERGQRASIVARADRLTGTARDLLELLAVLGREVPPSVLEQACDAPEPDVRDGLSALLRAGLARIGDAGWATAHDMIGEAVAGRLEVARSARLHAMVANALERTGEDAAELARHRREAGEARLAADAFARAATQALQSFAHAEAVQLADEGLVLATNANQMARLRETRGRARARLGDIAGARDDLRAVLVGITTGPARALLRAELATLASGADDLVRAAELAELALVDAGSDVAARARALETAAVLDMNLERMGRAAQRSAEAMQLYQELGDSGGTARVLDAQAMATFLAGDIRGGALALHRAADLFEDSGDLVRVLTPRSTSGHALVFGDRPAAGIVEATAALELARTLGHPEGQAYALWHCAEALAALGRADEATTQGREALAIATRIGHRGWTATAWRAVGIAAQAAGDVDTALQAFEESLALSDNLDLFRCWAAARAALVLVVTGDLDRAAERVALALDAGPELGQYEARVAQVELAAARGDEQVGELARHALARADAGGMAQGRARLVTLAQLA